MLTVSPACAADVPAASAPADYPVRPVPFTDVALTGGLLHERQEINRTVTIPFALEQCESQKRMGNFDLAAETMRRRAAGEKSFQTKPPTIYPFDDTDPYKAIEAASFSLGNNPDPAVAAKLEGLIKRIAAAQEPDGYLYTFRTMHPDSPGHAWVGTERWVKDPHMSHELYNLGHLFEAGVAHNEATGSRSLLDVCLKAAQLLQTDFGDGSPRIAPGHEVVEMGLVKLYRRTGDWRWLDLARFFIECRGRGGNTYSQDHKPVIEQDEAVGHAVRANYLYSGMADVAALTGDAGYTAAITKIWDNVVSKKLHLTGGCGALAAGEAYGGNYELPHRCYNETCAAIGFLYWTHRMFLMTGDAKFMDVFERTLYNGFLSGVSLSGDRFFYPNTLEYDGKSANNHGVAGRAPWFGCACCPPNAARLLASLGGYVAATRGDTLFVTLYASGNFRASVAGRPVKISQETRYPTDGKIQITVSPEAPADFELALRLPGWALGRPLPSDLYAYEDASPAAWSLKLNGEAIHPGIRDGFLVIRRKWKAGDRLELDLPMPVRRVTGNPKIAATKGQVALERGPVVYCFEGTDNGPELMTLVLPDTANIKVVERPDLLGGVAVLEIAGAQSARREDDGKIAVKPVSLTAIPYATWNNRGLAPMAVWLPRDKADARVGEGPTVSSAGKMSASFARNGMEPARANDRQMPRNPTDGFAQNFDFWPHKGGTEWLACEFAAPATVSSVAVSWFDDTGTGGCRLPKAWRLYFRDDKGAWQPVAGISDYPVRVKVPVTVTFPPVRTTAMKLEIDQPDGFCTGLYEWEIHGVDSKAPSVLPSGSPGPAR